MDLPGCRPCAALISTLWIRLFVCLASIGCGTARAEGAGPERGVVRMVFDAAQVDGEIRWVNGANFGPLCASGIVDLTAHQRALRLPSIRLHDISWTYPEVVDIHTIFRDARADPDNPASYDFRRTDDYIAATTNTGARVLFRLGESIEHTPRKYWVHPPADMERWARVCLNVVRHYNDGWANGFRHGILEWEIWNEPENQPACWTGTDDDYIRLYSVTARVLKSAYPELRVGGPAVGYSGRVHNGDFEPSAFVLKFLKTCRDQQVPLDFFSWHLYSDDLDELTIRANGVRRVLDDLGFQRTRSYLDEWNYLPNKDWSAFEKRNQGVVRDRFYRSIGSTAAAAYVGGFLMRLQTVPVDLAHYFSADNQGFGLFTDQGVPRSPYYAFEAFGGLHTTPLRVRHTATLPKGLEVLGATDAARRSGQVLLSNLASESRTIELQWLNLETKAGDVRRGTLFRIDQGTGPLSERVEARGEGSGSFRWEVPAHAFVWFRMGMD